MFKKKEHFFIVFLLVAIIAILPFQIWKTNATSKVLELPRFVIHAKERNILFQENVLPLSYYDKFQQLYLDEVPSSIRIRGNTSAFLEKKHYGLRFASPIRLAGMPKSKNWILVASHLDMTFMRNTLSYDLYANFSKGNKVSKTAYVDLYFEDKYHGLYVLTQRVDARSLQLTRKDPYAVLFKEPPINRDPKEHQERYEGFRNYILKHSRFDVYNKEEREKIADKSYYNQRFPKLEKENRANEIYAITEYIFNASDSVFVSKDEGIQVLFDLDNIIDWHLLLLLSNNGDGVVKNFYLYREREQAKYKICPWDYDHGYGRDGDAEPRAQTAVLDCRRLKLFERLIELNPDNYRERLRDKFLQLKEENILTQEAIFNRIDQLAAKIYPHVLKNQKRWPLQEHHFLKGADFNSEVDLMKDWIAQQLVLVEDFLVEEIHNF